MGRQFPSKRRLYAWWLPWLKKKYQGHFGSCLIIQSTKGTITEVFEATSSRNVSLIFFDGGAIFLSHSLSLCFLWSLSSLSVVAVVVMIVAVVLVGPVQLWSFCLPRCLRCSSSCPSPRGSGFPMDHYPSKSTSICLDCAHDPDIFPSRTVRYAWNGFDCSLALQCLICSSPAEETQGWLAS